MTDTDLILRHIDTAVGTIHRRVDDLVSQVTKINGGVRDATLSAAAARIVADEALLKVGQVHTATKDLRSAFETTVAGQQAVLRRDGRSVRWRDLILVFATGGALIAILRFLHVLPSL